jgi:hypothetical protein
MGTSLTLNEVRQSMSAEDVRLKRLWQALPDRAVSEEDAFRIILEIEGRYEGDNAFASLRLEQLRSVGAIVTPPNAAVQRSSEFPSSLPPDLVPGSEQWNEIRDQENREARLREIESENAAYRSAYEASPAGRERRELIEIVDARVDERIAELVREGKLSAGA